MEKDVNIIKTSARCDDASERGSDKSSTGEASMTVDETNTANVNPPSDNANNQNVTDMLNMDSPIPIKISRTTPQKIVSSNASPRKYRLLYEDMRARFNELKKSCDDQIIAHEKSIAEKDETIQELKSMLQKQDENSVPKFMKMNNNDIFVAKLRKGAKDVHANKCAISRCENANMDMIK